MGKPLITREEYKAYVGISSPNQDAEIDLLIPKVSQFVKTYCRTSFIDYVDTPKVEQFTGSGYQDYYLKEGPVAQILGVEASTDHGQTYTEFSDWVYEDETGSLVCINGVWKNRPYRYQVSYLCGYESVPEDLKLAVFDLITYYRRNDSSVHNSKNSASGNVQVEYLMSSSLPAHIRRVLDLYVVSFA